MTGTTEVTDQMVTAVTQALERGRLSATQIEIKTGMPRPLVMGTLGFMIDSHLVRDAGGGETMMYELAAPATTPTTPRRTTRRT